MITLVASLTALLAGAAPRAVHAHAASNHTAAVDGAECKIPLRQRAACSPSAAGDTAQRPAARRGDDRAVRFVATADPQYSHGTADASRAADTLLAELGRRIREQGGARGALIAGDLTQNARVDELALYNSAIGQLTPFVFDGIGNHDQTPPRPRNRCVWGVRERRHCVVPDRIAAQVGSRARGEVIANAVRPHYSWDWDDVHFVQLNLFPGNGRVSRSSAGLDPRRALDFLRDDLARFVGTSGRPVVLVHHYGFDSFSTGTQEVWWTDDERRAYWEVIAPYNVVLILTGHAHLNERQGARYAFRRPDGATGGPASIPSYVAGAAFKGIFLDVRIDGRRITVERFFKERRQPVRRLSSETLTIR